MLNLSDRNREAISSSTPWPVDFLLMVVHGPTGTCTGGSNAGSDVIEASCTLGGGTWVETDSEAGNLRLTNHFHNITVDGNEYVAAGEFLNFSDIADNLDVKDNTLDISLSGVEATVTAVILGNPIEGSIIEVSRGFYDEQTGLLYGATSGADLVIQPIYNRWTGSVNNYSITDDYNFTNEDKITVSISCKSILTTLIAKVAGRYTSPQSYETFNVDDKSMEFVPSLPTFNPHFGNEE